MSFWRRIVTEAHRRSLWQVLGIYLLGSWIGFQVILALVEGIGLPSWLPGFAAVLFLIGLPIVLATAFVQEGLPGSPDPKPEALDPTLFPGTAGGTASAAEPRGGVSGWLTWRRAIGAGVAAFAVLGLLAAAWLGMRALGIGPMASLLAAEEIHANDRILIAEFEPHGVDSTLASVVSDAFRIDFSRSTVVRTVSTGELQDVLRRMGVTQRPRIDEQMAHEIATRDGIPAYVTGDVAAAGTSFLLSARLISTATGEEIVALREKARDGDDIINAVDRLSRALRERTGESLKTVHRAEPLAKVTTASLPALQAYTQAIRAQSWEGDPRRAAELHREALRHDSTFAASYRALGISFNNAGLPDSAIAMLERALSYNDRLTEIERTATAASYHMARTEFGQAVSAYERLLTLQPDNVGALNNMGIALTGLKDFQRAHDAYRRSAEIDTTRFFGFTNLGEILVVLGRFDEAEAAYRRAARLAPQSVWPVVSVAQVRYAAGDLDEAERRFRQLMVDSTSNRNIRQRAQDRLQLLLRIRGRLEEAQRLDEAGTLARGKNELDAAWYALDRVFLALAVFDRHEEAVRLIGPMQRAIGELDDRNLLLEASLVCGWSGDAACARTYLARAGISLKAWSTPLERFAHAGLARAEGDRARALRILRETRDPNCHGCELPLVGRLFEELQQPDSAVAAYERYVATPSMDRIYGDTELAPMHERLGAYYEQRNDPAAAARHYAQFIELWKNADPPLQPRVAAARQKLQRLQPDR